MLQRKETFCITGRMEWFVFLLFFSLYFAYFWGAESITRVGTLDLALMARKPPQHITEFVFRE